jgi:hypothetical protein
VAVLALGLQTDVIGIHWLAFTMWAAAGLALGLPQAARGERPGEEALADDAADSAED